MLKVLIVFVGLLASVLSLEASSHEPVKNDLVIGMSWVGKNNGVDFSYEIDEDSETKSKPTIEKSRQMGKDVQNVERRSPETKMDKKVIQDIELIGNSLLAGQIDEDFHRNAYKKIDSRTNQFCDRLKINVLANFNKYIKLYRELCWIKSHLR